MLKNNKKKAWIKGSALSSVVLATTFLAACGGGGGGSGSGSTPSQTVEIIYPTSDLKITNENKQDFTIDVSSCTGLSVRVGNELKVNNDVFITSAFSCNGGVATAPFNKVKGYLSEDTTNTLKASVDESQQTQVLFSAVFAPADIIITSVGNTVKNVIPKETNYVILEGVTRKSGLSSVIDNVGPLAGDSNGGTTFTLKGTLNAPETGGDTSPDYSFLAAYDSAAEVTENYAANGRQFNTLAGIQINNTIYTSDMKALLGRVVGAILNNNLDKANVPPTNEICSQLFKGAVGDSDMCGLKVTDLLDADGELNPSIPPEIEIKGVTTSENGFEVAVRIPMGDFTIKTEFPIYGQGDEVNPYRTYKSDLTFSSGAAVNLTFFVEKYDWKVEKKDSAIKVIGIKLPKLPCQVDGEEKDCSDPDAIEIKGRVSSTKNKVCSEGGKVCDMPENFEEKIKVLSLESMLGGRIALQRQILDTAETGKLTLRKSIESSYVDYSVKTMIGKLKGNDSDVCEKITTETSAEDPAGNTGDVVCQALTVSGNVVTTAKNDDDESSNHGGFISFGGGTDLTLIEAQNNSVESYKPIDIRPMIGSLMNIKQASFAENNKLSNKSGAVIALSENMLNQALMAAYQTSSFDKATVTTRGKDENGKALEGIEIVEGVKKHLKATVSFDGMPTLVLDKAINGIKLKTPQINVVINYDDQDYDVLYLGLKIGTIKNGEKLISATIDVETALPLSAVGGLPSVATGSSQADIYVAHAVVEHEILKKGVGPAQASALLYSALPSLLASNIESSVKELLANQMRDPAPYNVEQHLTNTADNLEHEELLRGELPQTYTLVLPASGGINVDDESRSIHFSGNIIKTADADAKSLYTIKFYSDRCVHSTYKAADKIKTKDDQVCDHSTDQ